MNSKPRLFGGMVTVCSIKQKNSTEQTGLSLSLVSACKTIQFRSWCIDSFLIMDFKIKMLINLPAVKTWIIFKECRGTTFMCGKKTVQ